MMEAIEKGGFYDPMSSNNEDVKLDSVPLLLPRWLKERLNGQATQLGLSLNDYMASALALHEVEFHLSKIRKKKNQN